MIITFGLFWIVIKNNILYVIRTGNVDGGGLFFPNAINQLFTGLYFLEVCLIGLFFLVRDVHGKVACEAQGIIMSMTLVLTILYQIWLAMNFRGLYKYAPVRLQPSAPRRQDETELDRLVSAARPSEPADESTDDGKQQPLDSPGGLDGAGCNTETDKKQDRSSEKSTSHLHPDPPSGARGRSKSIQAQQRKDSKSARRILARLNRPVDEARLAGLEHELAQAEVRVGNSLVPRRRDIERQMMNDPISKIIMQHNDELENLDADERDMLISAAFTHPLLREKPPAVWIPRDELGVSDDEVRRTVHLSKDVAIDNRGAFFNEKLKVEVDQPPPDMSEFEFVLAEL